jgi:hypothetical protein
MEKRYQIFVSSTFQDLKEERQAVLRAILEMDHMPAGMELFPAADEAAWDLIKEVISQSDYYILIVGGRYGSLDSAGIGYTEKEYYYAIQKKLPVIALLHKNPDNLPRERTETDEAAWEKLKKFRSKVESAHTCKYWESADELKTQVVLSLISQFKRHPGIGWIRADQAASSEYFNKLEGARSRIEELENKLEQIPTLPPPGTEELASGKDKVELTYEYIHGDDKVTVENVKEVTWDWIFESIGPQMLQSESTLSQLQNDLAKALRRKINLSEQKIHSFQLTADSFDIVKIQLYALGLIQRSSHHHSVDDKNQYWTLSIYGEQYLTKAIAIRRR